MAYYEWDLKNKFVKLPKTRKKFGKVILRFAENRDKKFILEFERECVRTEPEIFQDELRYYQKRLSSIPVIDLSRKDFKVIIALVNNQVVGELSMSSYFDYETNSLVGVITGLWVLKPYRIAGIGKKLIRFAKAEFKKWGIKRITLTVGLFNLAACAFYKKMGFAIRKIGEGICAI